MAKYDEIGYWSELKLEIVRKYAAAYSMIMSKTKTIKKHIYIDAFAGPGKHLSRKTKQFVPGSPQNALLVKPQFSEFHFIDLDGDKAEKLRNLVAGRTDVDVYAGDCNELLRTQIFLKCKYEDFHRALCLLDPYKLNVDWKVLKQAGNMKSVEIFYNFMIMDANMNVLWSNPSKVRSKQASRMDAVWGDRSWRDAAYVKQPGLFGDVEEKATNEAVAEAFRVRLQDAGFQFVPKPLPMRNSKGAVIYYLFFASPNKTGAKIVREIFDKYRTKGAA